MSSDLYELNLLRQYPNPTKALLLDTNNAPPLFLPIANYLVLTLLGNRLFAIRTGVPSIGLPSHYYSELLLPKQRVGGSNPLSRSRFFRASRGFPLTPTSSVLAF